MNSIRQKQEKRKPEQTEKPRNSLSRIFKPLVEVLRKKPQTRKTEPKEPKYFSWAMEIDNDER